MALSQDTLIYLELFLFANFSIIAFLHMVSRRREHKSLGWFVVTILEYVTYILFCLKGWVHTFHWIIPINLIAGFLMPIFVLIHVKTITGRLRIPRYVLFLVGIGSLSMVIIHLNAVVFSSDPTPYINRLVHAEQFPLSYLLSLVGIQLVDVICIVLMFREARDFKKRLRSSGMDHDKSMLNYLRNFNYGLVFMLTSCFLMMLLFSTKMAHYFLIPIGFYIFLTINSTLFSAIPKSSLKAHDNFLRTLGSSQLSEKISKPQVEAITAKIEEWFAKKQLFKNPKLTLDQASKKMGISSRELSLFLNNEQHMNFFEFVNFYRVQQAKRLLVSEDHKNYTLEAIGMDAGFSSRTSFYRAFKKFERISPNDYRKDQPFTNIQ